MLRGNYYDGEEKFYIEFAIKYARMKKSFTETERQNRDDYIGEKIVEEKIKRDGSEICYIGNTDNTIEKVREDIPEIKDDYNEDREGKMKNAIGTTLVNLLNKNTPLYRTLSKYYHLIVNYDEKPIEKFINEAKNILEQIDGDKNIVLDNVYIIANALEDACKGNISKMKKEIEVMLKNLEVDTNTLEFKTAERIILDISNISDNDLTLLEKIDILNEVFENNKDILDFTFKNKILQKVDELEKELKELVNEPLKLLISKMFKQFNSDYNIPYYVKNDDYDLYKLYIKSIKDLEIRNKREHNNHPCSVYYREMLEYIQQLEEDYEKKMAYYKENENKINIRPKRPYLYEEFSCKQMAFIFIKSMLHELNLIEQNGVKEELNCPYYFNTKIRQVEENGKDFFTKNYKCEINCFMELYYISRIYIKEDNNILKRCNMCHKWFLTKSRTDEIYCRRKFEDTKKTCQEHAKSRIEKGKDTLEFKISKNINNIMSMMRSREKIGKHRRKKEANKVRQIIKEKEMEMKSEKITKEELNEWLKKYHTQLKAEYKIQKINKI